MTCDHPHPTYKPSGIEWLGDVPKHWEIRRLKSICKGFNNGTSEAQIDNGYSAKFVSRIETISNGSIDYSKVGFLSEKADVAKYELKTNDFLVSHINSFQRVGNSARYRGEMPLIHGMNLLRLTPLPEVMPRFLEFFFRTEFFTGSMKRACKPAINQVSVTTSALKAIRVPLPPLSEQRAIARYLDYMDRRIQRYIKAKERLIELLEEQRKARTEKAIAAGDVDRLRLDVVADVVERPVDRLRDVTYTPIGLYNRGRGIFIKEPTKGDDLGDSNFFWVHSGDLVISGQFAWEGAIALAGANEHGCVASHRFPILRGKNRILDTRYLLCFLQTDWGHLILDHHSRGAAGRNRPLNVRTLMKEKIDVLPIHSQIQIARMLENEIEMRRNVSRARQLLNEYRSRLIADVVTGKLDVREAAVALPEEAVDDEDMAGSVGQHDFEPVEVS